MVQGSFVIPISYLKYIQYRSHSHTYNTLSLFKASKKGLVEVIRSQFHLKLFSHLNFLPRIKSINKPHSHTRLFSFLFKFAFCCNYLSTMYFAKRKKNNSQANVITFVIKIDGFNTKSVFFNIDLSFCHTKLAYFSCSDNLLMKKKSYNSTVYNTFSLSRRIC